MHSFDIPTKSVPESMLLLKQPLNTGRFLKTELNLKPLKVCLLSKVRTAHGYY